MPDRTRPNQAIVEQMLVCSFEVIAEEPLHEWPDRLARIARNLERQLIEQERCTAEEAKETARCFLTRALAELNHQAIVRVRAQGRG